MKKFLILFSVFCFFVSTNTAQNNDDYYVKVWFGKKKNGNRFNTLLFNNDSTFEFYHYRNNVKEQSFGKWYQENEDTIFLTSTFDTDLIPMQVKINGLDVFAFRGNIKVKLEGLKYKSLCMTIRPYINGITILDYHNCFSNNDSIILFPNVPLESISFEIMVSLFPEWQYYKTETYFFDKKDLSLSYKQIDITINLDEKLANYKVFDNTKVIINKDNLYIENKETGKKDKYKISQIKHTKVKK